jgi:murein DD-endopeptidase MepM/ murein hydrolase activator NlpD
MKNAALKAKDAAARQMQEPQGSSPNEYAGNAVEEKAKGAAQEAVQTLDSRGRTAAQRTYQRARQKTKEKPAPEAPPTDATDAAAAGDTHGNGSPSGTGEAASGAPNSQAPAERAAPDRAKAQNRRAQQKKKNAPRQRGTGTADKPATTAPDSGSGRPGQPKRKAKTGTPKQKPGRTIGRSAKSAKTAQQSARQTQQAAKTAAKSAKAARQTAQRTKQAAEQAVKRGKDAVKAAYKAIKATIEGTKLLIEAIIAGGWVAVVIILVVCLAGFLIASPFGIFFSGGGEQSLPQVVQTLSKEYYDRFDLLQHNYVHDFLNFDGGTMSIDWPQVLAVYAVKVVNDPLDPEEVTTFDKKKTDKLRKILNEMNSFTYSVQNLQVGQSIERTLTIHIATKSAADMARDHHFNADQKAQLDELLSGDYADLWALLLGGYVPGGGEILQGDPAWASKDILAWPMQAGDYYVSSEYGLRDNPTSPGEIKFHSGIDLAADPGIPILAAADGIVTVANSTDSWGYGWGYYIKIDHGSGFVTLYAHCSQIAVCKDEEVQQGQVIGFIGETGNVTGPHLHFQIWKGGVVTNPTNFYTHQ